MKKEAAAFSQLSYVRMRRPFAFILFIIFKLYCDLHRHLMPDIILILLDGTVRCELA